MSILESISDVWVIWAISLILLCIVFRLAWRKAKKGSVKRLIFGESGASYALPYVLTFPVFLLLIALFLQATLIIVCKMGTMYAAHASARSLTVWQSSYSKDKDVGKGYVKFKAKRAAVMAMAPFANSSESDRQRLFPAYPVAFGDLEKGGIDLEGSLVNALTYVDRLVYAKAYRRLLENANASDNVYVLPLIKQRKTGVGDNYIYNKYAYAAAATKVEYPESTTPWNENIEVTVKYRMAFHIPGTARFFRGEQPLWARLLKIKTVPFVREIESTVVINSEAAETDSGEVGIPYDPSLLRQFLNADDDGNVKSRVFK